MARDDVTISKDDLCRITGLTDRRHRQLAEAGWFPGPVDGTWRLFPVVEGLLRYYRTAADRKNDQLGQEELRRTRADADLAEMRRDRMAGRLIDLETAAALWSGALGEMRNVIATFDIPKDARARLMAALRDIPLKQYQDSHNAKTDQPDGGEDEAAPGSPGHAEVS